MEEIWKDIQGYEGLYQVSNLGNVKSLHWHGSNSQKLLTKSFYGSEPGKRYYKVDLTKDGNRRQLAVHRLVADAFIPNPDSKPQVNHIDGIKTNNIVDNLEWATGSENMQHAYKNGLLNKCCVGLSSSNNYASRPIIQYDLSGNFIKLWPSISDAAKSMGCSNTSIIKCAKGNSEKCVNYIWRYPEE